MSHPILEKYRDLRGVNDENAVNAMLGLLVSYRLERQAEFFAQSRNGGRFYLFRNDAFPGKVIEYVPDYDQETSVTTLYGEHSIFESRQKLLNAREEIIGAIDHLLLAVPNTTTVMDTGRGKEFKLPELGTAQLLDVLNHFATH